MSVKSLNPRLLPVYSCWGCIKPLTSLSRLLQVRNIIKPPQQITKADFKEYLMAKFYDKDWPEVQNRSVMIGPMGPVPYTSIIEHAKSFADSTIGEVTAKEKGLALYLLGVIQDLENVLNGDD